MTATKMVQASPLRDHRGRRENGQYPPYPYWCFRRRRPDEQGDGLRKHYAEVGRDEDVVEQGQAEAATLQERKEVRQDERYPQDGQPHLMR